MSGTVEVIQHRLIYALLLSTSPFYTWWMIYPQNYTLVDECVQTGCQPWSYSSYTYLILHFVFVNGAWEAGICHSLSNHAAVLSRMNTKAPSSLEFSTSLNISKRGKGLRRRVGFPEFTTAEGSKKSKVGINFQNITPNII